MSGRVGPSPDRAGQIESEVRARVAPAPALLERVRGASERLVARAESAGRDRGSPLVRALVAGSAARETFLSDRLDIDLFLLFPPTLPRASLESEGLALARATLGAGETRYAEHPYLRGSFEGFAVDAVPGYAVEDPSRPLSAVDRTPFHQRYLEARSTPGSIADVRLAKQFLRGIGVYGSEAKTAGFSGYLVELLVLRFGGFHPLLEAARKWRLPVRLPTDPHAQPRVPDDVALILDDPVDPNRNVATALSARNLGLFVLAAGAFLDAPSTGFFEPRMPERWTLERGRAATQRRGTDVLLLALARPAVVDDILYPQLRKAERGLCAAAARLGFSVLGSASEAGPTGVAILVELAARTLPAVQARDGPPVGLDRGESFLDKWAAAGAPVLQGPFVDESGRLAVEALRPERDASELLRASLAELPLGKDLKAGIGPSTRLRSLDEAPPSPELERALAGLFGKRLPWLAPLEGLDGPQVQE